jgi:hypothetical protein
MAHTCPKISPYGEASLGEWGLITLPFAAAKRSEKSENKEEKERAAAATERERKSEFWNFLSSLDQLLRSTSICGPIELKFCRVVHDT